MNDDKHDLARAPGRGELRCPRRGGDLIAAERCLQDTACPLAPTCELRVGLVELVRAARREPTTKRAQTPAPSHHFNKLCLMCPRDARRGFVTCSEQCQRRSKSLRGGRSGIAPDLSPHGRMLVGNGVRK